MRKGTRLLGNRKQAARRHGHAAACLLLAAAVGHRGAEPAAEEARHQEDPRSEYSPEGPAITNECVGLMILDLFPAIFQQANCKTCMFVAKIEVG